MSYTNVAITSPSNDETIADNEGNVSISAAVQPGLGPSDKIEFVLDGKTLGTASTSTQISATGLDRGSHSVAARVLDAGGAVIQQSSPVTFHVRRTSAILRKKAP